MEGKPGQGKARESKGREGKEREGRCRGNGEDYVDSAIMSQDHLALQSLAESEEEDKTQQPSSQNTLFMAAHALNHQTLTASVPPTTQRGSPTTEEEIIDDVSTAIMPPAKKDTRGGVFVAIERRLIQESQDQRDAAHITPVSALRRAELF